LAGAPATTPAAIGGAGPLARSAVLVACAALRAANRHGGRCYPDGRRAKLTRTLLETDVA
jgi:hypothetical protein